MLQHSLRASSLAAALGSSLPLCGCAASSGPASDSQPAADASSEALLVEAGHACVPKTCIALGAECGSAPDGCGGVIACGQCAPGLQCGGGGPNRCCLAGWYDCDGLGANGCETDTSTSVTDCGACKTPCTFAHGTAACAAGLCKLTGCSPGFGDCDGNEANGCEANFASSSAHCGACGVACSAEHVCQSAHCICVPSQGGVEICDGLDNDCDGAADEDETRVIDTGYSIERCCDPPASYWCCAPQYGGSESGNIGDCCDYWQEQWSTVDFACD